MRWAIEVYFKNAKQYLGLLKEQSKHYVTYIASIHLTAFQFCLLVMAKRSQGCENITQIRQGLCSNSADISYTAKLWQVFRTIITGALDELKTIVGDAASSVLETIETHINAFLCKPFNLTQRRLGSRLYESMFPNFFEDEMTPKL